KGPEGSNPSPGAHLWVISAGFKTHGYERKNPPAITLERLATREEIEKSATADIGLDKRKNSRSAI
ncbi:MAG: hypothetical protein M3286_00140, partial [Thermoproteota archaeon]|nr:hypothetical protein [Thermoproteota archaeon]